ncbi:MAG: pitrilysin family protein [Candidatus Campbellbacteria bacterium]|nr:pitrilysin family protein [Candidatus Campbellbacteria bacterium]
MTAKEEVIELKNGVRILYVPIKGNPAVTVMTLVNVGSEFERKNESGLSHFLEHMIFKGTEKRPRAMDISLELDSIGAGYNAFTSHEYTGYYIKAAKRHFEKVTEVLADMTLNPALREEDINMERGVILEEINMYRDTPQDKVYDNFVSLIYGDQPAGRDILGNKDTIKNFSRRDFVSFVDRYYKANNTVIVVAGDIKKEKVVDTISALFKGLEKGKEAKKPKVHFKQKEPRLHLERKKTDQTHLILGSETVSLDHKDASPLHLFDTILGGGMSSRVSQKLREEMGVAYYAGSGLHLGSDHGIGAIFAGVTRSRAKEVVSILTEELRKLREEVVSEEELNKAKEYILGRLLLGLETSDSLARFYGLREVLKKERKSIEEIKKEINAVSAEDVRRVAKKYFSPERLNLAIIGNHSTENSFNKILLEK